MFKDSNGQAVNAGLFIKLQRMLLLSIANAAQSIGSYSLAARRRLSLRRSYFAPSSLPMPKRLTTKARH